MAPTGPVVFVVDDDASVRKSLARLVKAAGYEVEAFASVGDFLARAHFEGPGCLLLDVRMPGQTGLDLQETLHAAERRLSIVFITGHGDVRSSVTAMKGGAVDLTPREAEVFALVVTGMLNKQIGAQLVRLAGTGGMIAARA